MDDVYRLYWIFLSCAGVYSFLMLLHEAGQRGWIRLVVDAVGRFVKYSMLRQKKGGA